MTDTGHVTMRATFYGGPADGGELHLAEPIRSWLRFPLTPVEVLGLLAPGPHAAGRLVPNVAATYRLELIGDGRPYRDTDGRVRYLYVIPQPAPTPTERNTDD